MPIIKKHIQFILMGLATIIVQVFIFSNINLFSWLNPLVYSFFVFVFPNQNRMNLILYAFLLGLLIDTILNTGGINTLGITLIAFIREPLWKRLGIIKEDKNAFPIRKRRRLRFFLSIFLLILIHHFIIFSIENFNLNSFYTPLLKSVISSIITFIIILLFYSIFRIKIIDGEK